MQLALTCLFSFWFLNTTDRERMFLLVDWLITQMMIPPLWFDAVGWSWQMLDCFYWFYSVLHRHKQRCAFFPFPRFFCRCYKSGATTTNTPHVFNLIHIRSLAVALSTDGLTRNLLKDVALCPALPKGGCRATQHHLENKKRSGFQWGSGGWEAEACTTTKRRRQWKTTPHIS
jgi:hypothetical protein